MTIINCQKCGASEFDEIDGYRVCRFCKAKYIIESRTTISLRKDIETLLQKCKTDSKNAKRYANLVLDIDPDNEDALSILKK